jgi:hypothetical protein
VRGHLGDVNMLLEDCELLVDHMARAKDEACAADEDSEMDGEDADEMEMDALRDRLVQFSEALEQAVGITITALATLEGRASHSSRSNSYIKAATQLADIAGHCRALAGLLLGESGLPGSRARSRSLPII